MDATLAGLIGTTVGAVSGFSGAWLAQRSQVCLQRDQHQHAERTRWLDDKRHLYRELLIACHGWHDALVAISVDERDGTLYDSRTDAYKHGVEVELIAPEPVRLASANMRAKLLAAQGPILHSDGSDTEDALQQARLASNAFEEAVRSELVPPAER